MNIKIILVLAITLASILALADPAFADGSELDGKWAGTMAAPDGNGYPLNFNFKVDGSKLTGTTSTPQGEAAFQDGKVAGDDFTFNVYVGGVKVIFVGKLHDHVWDLSVEYQGLEMAATLKKVLDK